MVRIPNGDGAIGMVSTPDYVEMNFRLGGATVGVFWWGFDETVKGRPNMLIVLSMRFPRHWAVAMIFMYQVEI